MNRNLPAGLLALGSFVLSAAIFADDRPAVPETGWQKLFRDMFVQHNKIEVWNAPVSTNNDNRAPYFVRNVEQRTPPAKTDKNDDTADSQPDQTSAGTKK